MPHEQARNTEVHDVTPQILILLQEMMVMGANDSEREEVNTILNEYHQQKCDGEEALRRVQEIRSRKQDYH